MQATLREVQWANVVAFVALTAACLWHWRRGRGTSVLYAGIAFGSLGLVQLLSLALTEAAAQHLFMWFIKAVLVALVLFPYFLYKFAAGFGRPGRVETWIVRLTTAVVVGSTVAIPKFPLPGAHLSWWWTAYRIAILVQWMVLFTCMAFRMWFDSRREAKLARRRMQVLSGSAMIMMAATLLSGVAKQPQTPTVILTTQLMFLGSTLLFFLGLVPPRWIVDIWRRGDMNAFQSIMGDLLRSDTVVDMAAVVLPPSLRVVGARGGAIVSREGRVVGEYGVTAPEPTVRALATDASLTMDGVHRVEMRIGTLLVWTSAYAPFFGPDQFRTLDSLGAFADIVMERCALSEQLTVALAQAQEASRMKSAFLANLSHEIRTPMNGVTGMLGLMLDTELDQQQRDYAETMAGSVESLGSIIDDVLDFSKIEAGKLTLDVQDFDLRFAVDAAMTTFAGRAYEKGIELIAHIGVEVPDVVQGDRLRLRQVLSNLIANAIKFTDSGEVVVRVNQDSGDVVRFSVTDTGIGIASDQQSALFEPFTQADVSTTRRYGGTGLGLAICRQLVELMDGEISLHSEPGRGSTFTFSVPLRAIGAEAAARRAALPPMRVLVLADRPSLRDALSSTLRHWSLTVESAAGLASACDTIRQASALDKKFDVVIVDSQLRDVSQLEALHSLRNEHHLRVIGLSASHERGDAAAANAWLSKPLRHATVRDCLAFVITDSPAPVAHTGTTPPVRPAVAGRVLVVEDNAVNRKVAVALLDKLGYVADTAADGIEALDALRRTHYDVVLMDCQMPRMDGYEATAEIRRRETDHHTPIVAMTASAMMSDRERCLAEGMDDYLAKPIDRAALSNTLRRHMGQPAATA